MPAKHRLEIVAPPDEPTIRMRRVVDAPRAIVFDAFTRPEIIRRWMGPRALTWVVCEADLRVGGRYRWVQRAPDGREFAFHGEFRELVRPERVVRTFVFEGAPDAEAVETLTLEDQGDRTLVDSLTVHRTVAARDGHLAGGRAEVGMNEGFARLDDLVGELAAPVRKVAFTMYPVRDPERARAFYEKTLGLRRGSGSANGTWTEYDLPGGGCLALFATKDIEPSASAGGSIALEVADLDALNDRLKSLGVTYKAEMIHSPVCRMSVILDSEGNSLLLHELAANR